MSLFTIAEARAFDRGQLSDSDKFTDDVITAEAARIKEMFERNCGVVFEPTTASEEVHDGSGSTDLLLDHRPVIAVTAAAYRVAGGTTWTGFSADEIADIFPRPGGILYRESLGIWPHGVRNVRVTYSYGLATVPSEINRAALIVAVTANVGLPSSNLARTAMSISNDFGTTRLLTPGIGNSITGIGDVDVVLNDYRRRYFITACG